MLRAVVLLLVVLRVHSQGFNEIPEGQNYEVVFPRKLHAQHKRDTQQSKYPDLVQYGLEVNGQPMVLHLEKTEDLISDNYTETHYLKDGSPVTTSPDVKDHCFYQGHVKNESSSQVSLSTCDGLSGVIMAQEKKFFIQPLKTSEPGAHAVYEYQGQETLKTCGVDDTSLNETIMTKIDFSGTSQEKQAFLKSRKYIQLYIVADNSMYIRFNRREDVIKQRIYGIVNFVNQVYKSLNIFVALTGLEIWSNGDQFRVVSSANRNLDSFSAWRKDSLLPRKPHDNAQLLTNTDFDGSTIGLAWISTFCSTTHSSGVVQDHTAEFIGVGATLAHEMGHNLGMNHDDNCQCQAESCIMAPTLSVITPRTFSICSQQDYQKFILEHMPLCMKDKPHMNEIQSPSVCGNKFTERGEECDCGTVEECTDKCCDAATCKLKESAQCAEGECCSDCKLKSAGIVCRPAKDDCDLSDMCDGKSPNCPSDGFRLNGSPCKDSEGYCYNGKCPTLRSQCETYWGAGSVPADNSCYTTSRSYCPQSRYGECSVLYCSGGSRVPINQQLGYCTYGNCKTIRPEVLVESGTKCGDGKVCTNQRCIATPELIKAEACATKCRGHSVCNEAFQCQCEEGWAPPNCDTRTGNSSAGYIALGIIIVIVVLILGVVALVFYRRFQRKKQSLIRPSGAGSGVTNPTFGIQNQSPQQPNSYPYNPQNYSGRPTYPPQPPAQTQKPQNYSGRPTYPPQPPAQTQKPQMYINTVPHPPYPSAQAQIPQFQAFQPPATAPPQRPMYPPIPPQAMKPNYRR
ncbi:zinc metalloproteinase-disintegrin-like crotastatin isoform X3 [Hyla sarda]|uniref:zinc metalloproteinase-disintegrin-like crotastatin isoform X3 n=1 Tax=Hyla sarda TaxID=327740 RepID=UPI0024C30FEA|nr:zinc metalloproteinase-disintegrin-like crotastatin isoform X3 [Hyla sarda]